MNFSIGIRIIILLVLPFTSVGQSQTYAIKDVTVIPMNREVVLPDQTILVVNGVIKEMGSSGKVKVPGDAAVIDGKGKFLIPGLFDMHAHFFYEQGEHVNTCSQELKVMLANGLTTARILCGDPVYLEAREKVKHGEWIGPDLVVASPQFMGMRLGQGRQFAFICTTPAEAEAAVRKSKEEGYDEIKVTFMVRRDVYDAIIKTAKEVGLKVTGHVGPLVKLPAALAAREQIEHMYEFIDRLLPDTTYNHGQSVSDMNIWRKKAWETVPFLDEARIPALVKEVKDAGIYVSPTNYFFFSSFGDGMTEAEIKGKPDYGFIPAALINERWQIRERYLKNLPPEESRRKYVYLRKKMTYELWKAGVKLMAGSDSPEWFLVTGFSLHDELETFVKAGLTPFAALQTATVNTATYLGIEKRKGTIEIGKEADLILLDQSPLKDIRSTRTINTVFKGDGRWDRKKLDQLLQEGRDAAK